MRPLRLLAVALAAACALSSRAAEPAAAPPRDYGKEAFAALAAKDPARGEAIASEGLAARPDDEWLLTVRGYLRAAQGRLDEAEADLLRSIAIKDNVTAHLYLAKLEAQRGRHPAALTHLRRAVELKPTHARAWARLAEEELIADHPVEGLRAINEAYRLDPKDDEVEQTHLRIGRFFNLTSLTRPREAVEHHARGGELAATGKWREAAEEYQEALRHDPEFADCHYNLGLAADALGDLERAEREYLLAIEKYEAKEAGLRDDAINNLVYVRVRRGTAGPEDVARQRRALAHGETTAKLDTLARVCDATGDQACALEAFRKVVAAPGQVPEEARAHARARVEALEPAAAPPPAPSR